VARYDRFLSPGAHNSLIRTIAWGWVRTGDMNRARAALAATGVEGDSSDAAGWLALYEGNLKAARGLLRGGTEQSPELALALGLIARLKVDTAPAIGKAFLALAKNDSAAAAAQFSAAAENAPLVRSLLLLTAALANLLVVTVGQEEDDGSFGFLQAEGVSAGVMDALIELAVSIGVEGWEGRPVGALFVVGDSSTVMEKSRQLTLNPFQGYSEDEKNIMNPDVRHALHAFAVLDGAFIVREDGVVVAAGRYLNFDEEQDLDVPLGLGARHMAAAGISRDTEAIAIVVSQTSGSVRVFRGGKAALELAPRVRRS